MPSANDNPKQLDLTAAVEIDLAADQAPGMTDSAGPQVPRFSMVAYTGGAMKVAGWRFPVVVDFEGLSIPSQARPIRLAHDPDRLVGHSSAIAIDAGRLIAAGLLSIPGADTDKVVAALATASPGRRPSAPASRSSTSSRKTTPFS